MSEVNETQAAVPSNLDLKAAPTPNTGVPATNPLASTQPTPALVVRASSTVRNVQPPQKSDSPARTPSTPLLPPDHRDANKSKDTPKPEEVSEYVSHGIDPSAPIYEITHAIPDSLILKCADCQRFARVQPQLPGMELLPGPGDRGVNFKCSRCGGGQQTFRHSEKTWLEITLTSLYNLELQDKHKEGRRFFHVRQEICSFADRNWDVICLGRTRTPTWWATLNAQITTRTDLFETSKHGSGNWALRHSNITHPVQPSDMALLDPAKEIPPEKPTTMKLNATAIVSKKVLGDRKFYLVTLEGNNGTVWRESNHPCFKSGELIRKFTKVDPKDPASLANAGLTSAAASPKAKSTSSRAKAAGSKGSASSSYLNQYSSQTPLGVIGVFTEKVVKAPSRLSRRQQSKHDAALAAAQAAAASSPSTPTTTPHAKHISPMAEAYRKTSKAAAGLDGSYSPSASGRGSNASSASGAASNSSASGAYAKATSSVANAGAVTKMPNGQMVNMLQTKLAHNSQPMRCHQCNRRQLSRPKPGQEFVFCTRTMSKVQGDQTLHCACANAYCLTCIDLIYHEHPLENEHDTATWICPACRKICTCATCNDYVDPSGQAPTPNMVVTSSTPTAQLHQQQMQYQKYQMQQQYHHSASSSSSSTSSFATYDSSESPPGEDASSTTTVSYGTPSSKSTPSGSTSLSPNVSTWASTTATSSTSTSVSGSMTTSAYSAAGTGKQPAKSNGKKIVVPVYDNSPTSSPHGGKKDAKSNSASGQPSPHNTRSNSGNRNSSHPLSLYTQSLVSRGPSNRKRSNSSTSNGTQIDLRTNAPSQSQNMRHSSTYVSATMPDNFNQLANGSVGVSMHGVLGTGEKRRRLVPTTDLTVNTSSMPHSLSSYNSLPSPTVDIYPGLGSERMFLAKGKRPHSELSSSTGDIQRGRRSSLLDEPVGKRRIGVNSSMDDMGDLFGTDLQSPRQCLSHFTDDEDDHLHHAHSQKHPHHHHHHHSHHSSHVTLDDSLAKDVGVAGDPLSDDPIILPPSTVVTTTSINPAQIMMGDYFDPGMDGQMDSEQTWSDAPIPVNNFETPYF